MRLPFTHRRTDPAHEAQLAAMDRLAADVARRRGTPEVRQLAARRAACKRTADREAGR